MDSEAVDTRGIFFRREYRPGGILWRHSKKTILRAIPEQSHDVETVKTIAMFCGVGMVVSLFWQRVVWI
jgi:hypothetical protein